VDGRGNRAGGGSRETREIRRVNGTIGRGGENWEGQLKKNWEGAVPVRVSLATVVEFRTYICIFLGSNSSKQNFIFRLLGF
jgi:hypothetical protein